MNAMSLLSYKRTGRYYTPTKPVTGLCMMLAYALSLLLGLLESQVPFRIAMAAFVMPLFTRGVLIHLTARDRSGYSTATAKWSAIAINLYGVAITTFAAFAG